VSQGLNETAWSIVSGFYQSLANNSSTQSESSLEISEAARLAGLTFALSSRNLENQYSFSHLSYEAERLGVSQDTVTKLADEILETYRYTIPVKLDSEELVALLGMIHSLGCYSLPLACNEGTSQKPLGAYYTPPAIANYIVSLTLSQTLDRLAVSASTRGIDALEEILSLRTLDPACGTGVFLVSAMSYYTRAMKEGIENALAGGASRSALKTSDVMEYSERIHHNLFGVDIDSGALEVTDVSLRLLANTDSNELGNSTLGKSLKQGNSLISLKGLNGVSDHGRFFTDAASRSPFEWRDEFGDILDNGGFDFIVMNPPYERLKPNLAEFLRERLLTGEREIYMENFSKYKEKLSEDVHYFRNSGEYQLGNRYSIDTHRLFIERTLQLTSEQSNIGFIVPSTILGDLSSQPLRSSIMQENRLLTVDDFPETSRLFEGVTQSVSVMTLKRGGKTKSFLARFGLNDIGDTLSRNHIRIPADKIERTVGPSLSIPQVNKSGWKLLSKLHRQPSISSIDWLSVKRGELDLTLNRDCITSKETDFRLIRGSNISRYSINNHSERRIEFVDIDKLRKKLGTSSRAEHIGQPRIACQQVSNRTQRWRLKFSVVPPDAVLANSCNYLIHQKGSNESRQLFFLGVLNSELMNWRFGLTNANNHVSTRELTQLPIADLETLTNRDLRSYLIEEVKQFKPENSHKIEALVFALYGFSTKDTNDVLKLRRTPEGETNAIIEELKHLIY
jgi:Alw26I/Eco31I/Esp3I family type II restriction m6 adenine DNA methyltransferase